MEPEILTGEDVNKKLATVERGLKPALIEGPLPDRLLQDRMSHFGATNVSIAIIDGDTITPKTYHLSTSSELAATTETLFQAGSISKFVNAVIALKLVEEGKLSLDENVNSRLKAWKVPENKDTKNDEKVTLRRLLSHTAGLNLHGFPGYVSTTTDSELPSNEAILRGGAYLVKLDKLPSAEEIREQHLGNHYIFVNDKDDGKLFYIDIEDKIHAIAAKNIDKMTSSIQKMLKESPASSSHAKIVLSSDQIQSLIDTGECSSPATGTAFTPGIKPIQAPGSKHSYSGGGIQVVQQLIVEAMGGKKSYAEIAKEKVFDPLSMTSSTFAIIRPQETKTPRVASGHMGDGSPVKGNWHLHPESAAAGLWTTPTDLAKFVIGIQNNSILKEATTTAMLTPQPNSHYGLGPYLNPMANEFSHGAGTLGFSASCVGFSKGIKKGAIVMTNSDNSGELCQELNRSIASAYEWPKVFSDQSIQLSKPDTSILSPLVGDYNHPIPNGFVRLTISQKEGRFFITGPFPTLTSPRIECELKQGSDDNFYFQPDPDYADRFNRITLIGNPPNRFELFGHIAEPEVANVAVLDSPHTTKTIEPSKESEEKISTPITMESSVNELSSAQEIMQQYKAARAKLHEETSIGDVIVKDVSEEDDGSITPSKQITPQLK